MQGIIRLGEARKGDRVSRPEHGDTTIHEGRPNYRDRDVPVAARLSAHCSML